jgi:hypothetical protein
VSAEKLRERHARAVQATRENKEALVARGGIGSDVKPLLTLMRDGAVLAGFPLEGDRHERIELIAQIVTLSDAPFVHFADESYSEDYTDLTPGDALRAHVAYDYGSLAKRFAAHDPRVVECVTVVTVDAELAMLTICPYRYKGRRITWLEKTVFDDEVEGLEFGGGIPGALRRGLTNRAGRGPALPPRQISSRLNTGVILRPEPPRNAPCSCGSGRKAKACCW